MTEDDFARLALKVAKERLDLTMFASPDELKAIVERNGCTMREVDGKVMLSHPDSEWEADMNALTRAYSLSLCSSVMEDLALQGEQA